MQITPPRPPELQIENRRRKRPELRRHVQEPGMVTEIPQLIGEFYGYETHDATRVEGQAGAVTA